MIAYRYTIDNTDIIVKDINDIPAGVYYIEVQEEEPIIIVEVPQIVTNAQFRLALIEKGQSISNINAFINSKEEPLRDVLNSLWEYANHFERQNPQLISMATLLGLTSEQLDNLFIIANTKLKVKIISLFSS